MLFTRRTNNCFDQSLNLLICLKNVDVFNLSRFNNKKKYVEIIRRIKVNQRS